MVFDRTEYLRRKNQRKSDEQYVVFNALDGELSLDTHEIHDAQDIIRKNFLVCLCAYEKKVGEFYAFLGKRGEWGDFWIHLSDEERMHFKNVQTAIRRLYEMLTIKEIKVLQRFFRDRHLALLENIRSIDMCSERYQEVSPKLSEVCDFAVQLEKIEIDIDFQAIQDNASTIVEGSEERREDFCDRILILKEFLKTIDLQDMNHADKIRAYQKEQENRV